MKGNFSTPMENMNRNDNQRMPHTPKRSGSLFNEDWGSKRGNTKLKHVASSKRWSQGNENNSPPLLHNESNVIYRRIRLYLELKKGEPTVKWQEASKANVQVNRMKLSEESNQYMDGWCK